MRPTTLRSIARRMLAHPILVAWLVMLALPAGPRLQAQDTSAFNLRQTADLYDTRGFFNGSKPIYVDGKLVISEASGGVSYSYPISSYTKKGYPISVSLNYCGAVNCTTFGAYTTSNVGGFGGYRQNWNRFDQSRPVWVLSLNGWGIQCLSQATAFHAPPDVISSDFNATTSTRTSFNDRTVPWVIDGYDYCNRMRNLATGSGGQKPADYVDVIRLLRGDGSVLELHNSKHAYTSNFALNDSTFVGYYRPSDANDNVFAIVSLDTANRPGFLTSAGVNLSILSQVHQLQPRVAHVFTGDGLEYTFREVVIPYGTADYNAASAVPNFGGMVAGPTIFYLTEISSDAGPIMTVKRSRQMNDNRYLWPVLDTYDPGSDSTRGRALVTEFDDHAITYDRDQLTIQALGRTTLVRFTDVLADGNAQDSIGIPFQRLGYPGKLSRDEAALGLNNAEQYKSWLGYVNEIVDPEGRSTTFEYEQVLRQYQNCGFPYLGGTSPVNFYLRNLRLKTVTEPTAKYEIAYRATTGTHSTPYGPNDWIPIFGVSYGSGQTRDPELLRDLVDSVVKSDCSGPLSVEAYAYQGQGSTISMVQHTTKDLLAGTNHTRKFWYEFRQLDQIVSDLPRARFTELVKTHDTIDASATSPAVGVLTVTTYDSLAHFIVQPKTVTETVDGLPKTRTRYEYVIRAKPTYETDTAALARYGWEIGQKTEYTGCACDTALFNNYATGRSITTKYLSLPEFHVSFGSGAGRYDEHESFKNYQDYYAAHPGEKRPEFEAVKYDPAFAVWDENDSDGFYLPPVFDLDTSVVTTAGTGSIDRRTWYATGNFVDGTHVPRGWPLRDTTYGTIGSGPAVIGGGTLRSYIYDAAFSQWRPFSTTNGVGAVSEGAFSGDSLAGGMLDDRDSAWIDRHAPPNALAWTFEQPTLDRRLVRRTFTGGGTRTDTLTTHHDYTFYGLPAETIDPNGWSTRGAFDRDGRLNTLRLPLDYDAVGAVDTFRFTGTKQVALYGSTVDTITYDTAVCDKGAWAASHGTTVSTTAHAYERFAGEFQVDRPTIRYPSCANCSGTKKGDQGSLQTTCLAIPFQYRSPRWTYIGCRIRPEGTGSIVSLDSARLVLLVTQNETRCANVIVEIPQFNFKKTYVFGCLDAPVLTSHNGSRAHSGTPAGSVATLTDACDEALTEVYRPDGYLFRVNLASIKDSLIAAGNRGDWVTVRLSTSTPGASMTFSSDFFADYRPSLELVGSFATYADQDDYTLAYEHDDEHLKTTVRAKVDDSRHTANHIAAGGTFAIRQSERVHRFGADFRVRKSFTTIGDPASPTRIDSVVNRHNGLGAVTRVSDQNGDTTATEYDALGRPIRIYDADGSTSRIAYYYGHAATFGLPVDTQRVGLRLYNYATETFYDSTIAYVCDFLSAKVTSNENGTKSAQYFDGLDRLRREVVDSGGGGHLHLTTTFDYDQLGRMTRSVNPKGDTTLYVYDELGRVLYKTQPDLGTVSYAYDRLGNVRFSQSQEQADSNRLTYTEYDDLNRVTLIGEATVDPPGGSAPSGTRAGGSGATSPRGGKERSSLQSGASTLHRLTDTLNGNRLYLSSTYTGPITVNTSLHLGSSGPVPPTLPALTLYDSVYCTLMMNEMLGETEAPTGPFIRHPVQYYAPVTTPHGSMGNFEHLKFNPHFARTAIAYDTFPPIAGTIWGALPAQAQWDSLAPGKRVRNVKGHEVAIAYREHGGEPYHYVVMSYDERGRVEALLRWTENLGFDAVYYSYNSANQVTSVRAVDPIRQYQSWYGYDWNARVDSVWSLLGGVWSGLGVRSPHYPAPLTQPATADIVYDYTKVGQLASMRFPPAGVLVSYAYDHRKWLDSLVAVQGTSPLFKEVLGYDPTGQIITQRFKHGAGTEQTELYRYDSAQRLVRWVHGTDSTSWAYDAAGNRSGQIRRVPLAGLRADAYTYGGTGVGGANRLGDVITQDSTGAVTGVKQHTYNANGSTTSRTALSGLGGTVLKEEHFGYGYRELTNQYIDGAPTSSSRFDWRYRYNAQGEREQKRLYYGPDGDEYEHVYPWVYYLLGGAKEQLAVYHGQQILGGPCAPSSRSVLLYPVEYITTGLGYTGAREAITPLITTASGGKRFRISDHLASLRAEIGPSGTGHYDYDPWGVLTAFSGTGQSRLTYNDHEKDGESGDINLGVRHYDPNNPVLTSVDPLWGNHPNESPYIYCSDNPLRLTDPTGMQASVLQLPYEEGGEGVPSGGGASPAEVYLANHPEIAADFAYDEKWGEGGKNEEGGGKSKGADEENSGKGGTLQADESIQTAEATAKASAKAQDQMERSSGQRTKPGTDFSRANKRIVWEQNAEKYSGKNKCENCGQDVVKPSQHTKGVTPPTNEGHVDHIDPKSNGGQGTPDNGQVLCRDCNLQKGNKTP